MAEQGRPTEVGDHPVTVGIRAVIDAVRHLTCETHADLGGAIGLSGALVGRRQKGTTRWDIAEVAHLADHWRVPVYTMFKGPTAVLESLPERRVDELRAVKGKPPVSFKSLPVAA